MIKKPIILDYITFSEKSKNQHITKVSEINSYRGKAYRVIPFYKDIIRII